MPSYQAHPEVWVLVAALVALGGYARYVIGPKVVPAGQRVVTRRQVGWFAAGVLLLWASADWPIHDIAEQRLYSVHMVQHLAFSFAVAPMFLLACPTWLAQLLLGEGRWLRRLAHPVAAGLLYNGVTLFLHWQNTVNTSVSNAPVHFGLHLLLMAVSLLMWMPICGPMPDLRMSLPGQMVYLFMMSIVPTIPAAWLALAEGVVYSAYDVPVRMFGWSATTDQQVAGLIMKLGAGIYLWGLILVLFFKWAGRHMQADRAGRTLSERDILTWEQAKRELDVTPSGS